jgi:hypothetical protein
MEQAPAIIETLDDVEAYPREQKMAEYIAKQRPKAAATVSSKRVDRHPSHEMLYFPIRLSRSW